MRRLRCATCSTGPTAAGHYNRRVSETHPSQIDQVCDRVERLLLRHEELRRTNHLLQEQIDALVHERDSLKSRLGAARARIDSLIERLPALPPRESRLVSGDDGSSEQGCP